MQFINGQYQSEPDQVSRVNTSLTSPGTLLLGTQTATANGVAGANASENVNAMVVTVVVTAVSGTSPTLTVYVADAATAGGGYTTRNTTLNNITAVGTYTFLSVVQNNFYKPGWVVGGTTPSFTFSVYANPFVYGPVV